MFNPYGYDDAMREKLKQIEKEKNDKLNQLGTSVKPPIISNAKASTNKVVATAAPNPYQRIQELYSLQSKSAANMLNSYISQYDADKNAKKSKIDNEANTAHQQAYISYMLQKKEMPQLLAAMGISGGGAESTVSSMQNTYGQNRNKIDTQRNESVSDLEAQYTKLKNDAKRKFDQQMYEYDLQYQQKSAGL